MLASGAGCAHRPNSNYCLLSSPYRPEEGERYSERNERWIVSHNDLGEKICGWKP